MPNAANPAKPRTRKSKSQAEPAKADVRLKVLTDIRENFAGGSFARRLLFNGGLMWAAAKVAREVQGQDLARANHLLAATGAELAAMFGLRGTTHGLVGLANYYATSQEAES